MSAYQLGMLYFTEGLPVIACGGVPEVEAGWLDAAATTLKNEPTDLLELQAESEHCPWLLGPDRITDREVVVYTEVGTESVAVSFPSHYTALDDEDLYRMAQSEDWPNVNIWE